MPKKLDPDVSYVEKILALYSRLLFSGQKYSLTALAKELNCSKQTVSRLISSISGRTGLPVSEGKHGRRKYYWTERPRWMSKPAPLTPMEYNVLRMCQAFTAHLLGPKQFEEAVRAIGKSRALMPGEDAPRAAHFASLRTGRIDYAPHQDKIRTLIEALDKSLVCKVVYQRLGAKRGKTFYIKPLKLISHQDSIYLHARRARTPGQKYVEPDYDPLLAVHRLKSVETTAVKFEYPEDYDFDRAFAQNFGVIKDEPFRVQVEFTGWAAAFAAERIWSNDQEMERKGDGRLWLAFTATSPAELIGWLLWFGEEAKCLSPKFIVDEVKRKIEKLNQLYQNNENRKTHPLKNSEGVNLLEVLRPNPADSP